ncbi:hypothetical protein VW35_02355 [Devosia soli]|uniref:Uncharacterized protein n=1 Tax=Devosia soli TaxID=361041 RepID=A0A0F5LFG8_9HYPH|nr:hypothetical protein VW35_02355 [Devosia soli]
MIGFEDDEAIVRRRHWVGSQRQMQKIDPCTSSNPLPETRAEFQLGVRIDFACLAVFQVPLGEPLDGDDKTIGLFIRQSREFTLGLCPVGAGPLRKPAPNIVKRNSLARFRAKRGIGRMIWKYSRNVVPHLSGTWFRTFAKTCGT